MNVILMTNSPFCAAPNGANWLLLAPFPTLKRGANHHCASGAIEIGASLLNNGASLLNNGASLLNNGASLLNNLDSCDCPEQAF